MLAQATPDLRGAPRPGGKKVERLLIGALGLVSGEQVANRGGIEDLALTKTSPNVRREREGKFTVQEDVHPLQSATGLQRNVRNRARADLFAIAEKG